MNNKEDKSGTDEQQPRSGCESPLACGSRPPVRVGGVENFSIVDWPGKIVAVAFLQGCPWRCPFCYNALLQDMKAKGDVVWDRFFEFLKTRTKVLDGVVFSGGEPLVQDSLKDAVKQVKELGYVAGLHTGGFRPSLLEEVLPDLSWVGFDIKAPFEKEKYKKAVGGMDHLKEVQKSLDLLIKSGIDFECRTTCDPRILDIEDIYTIADTLKSKGVKKYYLQKYRQIAGDNTPDYECEKFFNDKKLEEYLKSNFEEVELRK